MEDEFDEFADYKAKQEESRKAFQQQEAVSRKKKEIQEICSFLAEIKQKVENLYVRGRGYVT